MSIGEKNNLLHLRNCNCVEGALHVHVQFVPSGQDLQSSARVPGALSKATNEPVGHLLQFVATWPTLSEKKPPE